jgi:hypothetical protein
MTFADQHLLGYFPPGPLEMVIICAIVVLLFWGHRPTLTELFRESLRRDPQLRNQFRRQWFCHASQAEQRAERILTFVMHLLFWGAFCGLLILLVMFLHRAFT